MFMIGPDRRIKLILTYPMSTGRNFDEVLRVLESMQLTAKHKVATPVNWKPGEDVIIIPAVSDAVAKKLSPIGWEAPKPYLRIVSQPNQQEPMDTENYALCPTIFTRPQRSVIFPVMREKANMPRVWADITRDTMLRGC
jgi:hypothetical protein